MTRILTSLFIIAAIAASVTTGAMALWTDQETSANNTFTTGTLDIALTENNPLPLSVTAMAPGDSVTGTLNVANSGTLELRYAMTTTGDDTTTLDEQLDVEVKLGATPLYSGKLSSAAIGDSTQGAQAGDRTLSAGNSETLTFIVSMPLDTANSYQGESCSVTFVFDAEQTANNP